MTRQTITEHDKAFLDRVRATVHEVEPGARIILYGSRARGDAELESDWDLLVLVDGPVDYDRVETVRHRLYELELETDTILSAIVRGKQEWDSPLSRALPFHANVEREGVEL